MIPDKEIGPRVSDAAGQLIKHLTKGSKPLDLLAAVMDNGDNYQKQIISFLSEGKLSWAQNMLIQQAARSVALAVLCNDITKGVNQ